MPEATYSIIVPVFNEEKNIRPRQTRGRFFCLDFVLNNFPLEGN